MNINKKITEIYKSELGSIYFIEREDNTGIPADHHSNVLYNYDDPSEFPLTCVHSNNSGDGMFSLGGLSAQEVVTADHQPELKFAKFGKEVWRIYPGKMPEKSTLRVMDKALHPDVNGVLADMATREARLVFDEEGAAYILRNDFKLFYIACSDLKNVITPLSILDETGKVNRYLTANEVSSLPKNSYRYIWDIKEALEA